MITKYSRSLVDIMQLPANAQVFLITILSVVDNGDGTQTLFCSDIFHAQPTFTITINNVDYIIADIDYDVCSLTVTGSGSISPTTFHLYPFYFFYGDPIETGIELKKEAMASNKTPMYWLKRKFKQKFSNDISTSVERWSSFSLFVLTQTQPNKFEVADSYHNCIEPMFRGAENFLQKMKDMPGIFNMDGYSAEMEDWTNFGVWLKEKGTVKLLWSEKLAGVEIIFETLPILRDGKCADCGCGEGIGNMIIENNFIVN